MDKRHVNAHHVMMGNSDGFGNVQGQPTEGSQTQGSQAQGAHLQNEYNDYAVDPSLTGASSSAWQQNAPHNYTHQNVFDAQQQQQQQQLPYGQHQHYGQSPNQSQRFDYRQSQQQQQVFPTHYASLYGQSLPSSGQNASSFSNDYGALMGNSQVNNANGLSQAYPNFANAVDGLSYQTHTQTPRSTTSSPNELGQNQTSQSSNQSFFNPSESNEPVQAFASNFSPQGQTPSDSSNAKQNVLARPVSANDRRESSAPASTPQPTVSRASSANQALPSASAAAAPASAAPSRGPLRVTHPELLAAAKNNPSMRVAGAPFLVIDPESISIDDRLAFRPTPTGHLKTNRSGRELVPGLYERIIASSKNRGQQRPPKVKTTTSTTSRRADKVRNARSSTSSNNSPHPSDSSEDESSSDYSSDDYSDDYSDDEMIGDIRPLAEVRTKPRPSDPVGAARYDAFTILYSPVGRRPAPDEMQKAGAEYPSLIAQLREQLNKVNADLQTAQAKKQGTTAIKLKAEQRIREEAIVTALRVAVDCHDEMRDTLLSGKLMAACSNMLRGCLKAGDYFGDLPVAILELMSRLRFSAKNPKLLSDLKIDAIAKKFYKSVAEQSEGAVSKEKKAKLKELLDLVTGVKAYEPGVLPSRILYHSDERHTLPVVPEPPIPIVGQPAPAVPAQVAAPVPSGLKRPHDADPVADSSNKRAALTSNKPSAKPVASKPVVSKPTISPSVSNPNSIFARPSNTVPRPTSSIPPTTAPPVKKPVPRPSVPAVSKPSVLAGLLASIEEPKEQQKAPVAPAAINETPEERKKRERKESRRHLRVKFREGSALEQIRLFTHEKAEDEGREEHMLRDAHDDRSEGMKLKERVDVNDVMEDDEQIADINATPYRPLLGIDYSAFSEDVLKKEPVTKGGVITAQGLKPHPSTSEQLVQDQREATELMALYNDEADMPPTPREPPAEMSTGSQPAKYAPPTDPVLAKRLEKFYTLGTEGGRQALIQEAKQREGAQKPSFSRVVMAEEGVNAVLDALKCMAADNEAVAKIQKQVNLILEKKPEDLVWRGNFLVDAPDVYIPRRMDPQGMARTYKAVASVADEQFPATKPPTWMAAPLQADYALHLALSLAKTNIQPKEFTKTKEPEQDQTAALHQYQQTMSGNGQAPLNFPPGFPPIPPPNVDANHLASLLAGAFGQLQVPPAQQAPNQWAAYSAAPSPVDAAQHNPYAGLYSQYGAQVADRPQNQWNNYGAPMLPGGQYSTQNQDASNFGQPTWGNNQDGNTAHNGQSTWGNNHNQSTWATNNSQPTWGGNNGDGYGKDHRNSYDGGEHNNKKKGKKGKKNHNDGFQRDPNYKKGTKPCLFFRDGNCKHGDDCTFIHER